MLCNLQLNDPHYIYGDEFDSKSNQTWVMGDPKEWFKIGLWFHFSHWMNIASAEFAISNQSSEITNDNNFIEHLNMKF